MRRIEPAVPDLLPLSFQLGPTPSSDDFPFDPVELRLPRTPSSIQARREDRSILRRPARLLVHSAIAREERDHLSRLLEVGYGLLVVLADDLRPEDLPAPVVDGQIVAVSPWAFSLWGGRPSVDLCRWKESSIATGVLVGLAPCTDPFAEVAAIVEEARDAGVEFLIAAPLVISPEERHRVYDRKAGESGDQELENAFFHGDFGQLSVELEREASRRCRAAGLADFLPGPATSAVPGETFAAGAALLAWARRLDLMDGVGSVGWQLRRGAHALLAAGRDLSELLSEDNLRIVPGFTPWVEAFARSLWAGGGVPFDDARERWLAH